MSPQQLIDELVDEKGHQLPVGGQEDVSEFMLKFVDQLEEGFYNEKEVLQSFLFGEQIQLFSYRESEEVVVNEECSSFLQIFLDVKHKDLYAAWAAASQQEVDYTTPKGSKADGQTRVWIRRLPKLLFFQLQRVTYDPEKKVGC